MAAISFPGLIPEGSSVEIPVRGTLTCGEERGQCRFVRLSLSEAIRLVARESAADSSAEARAGRTDPHVFDNPGMGMHMRIADGWALSRQIPGTYSRPSSALFGKAGALAVFMLTREHMETTPELYGKILESGLAKQDDFQRASETDITRDGLTGKRWEVRWSTSAIQYAGFLEFFTVGDDHYRVSAMAPVDVYGRYRKDMDRMARSLEFPLLRLEPKFLDSLKP